jgi:hypothetical protein
VNDTWTFDGRQWREEHPAVAPSARAGAHAAFDEVSGKVVLYGGFNGTHLGDTWLWDGATSEWTATAPVSSPDRETGPVMFTDPSSGRVILYGGFNGHFYSGSTWEWRGDTWTQLPTTVNPWARSSAAAALDETTQDVVMFGGLGDVNPTNTWSWGGSDWQQEDPLDQPALVYDAGAAFLAGLNQVVVFAGGSGGEDLNDLWTWTGTDWQRLDQHRAPEPRESFLMVNDEALGAVVVFGGLGVAAQAATVGHPTCHGARSV